MNTITTPKRNLTAIMPGVYHAKGQSWYACVIDRDHYVSASFTRKGEVWRKTCRTIEDAKAFVENHSTKR